MNARVPGRVRRFDRERDGDASRATAVEDVILLVDDDGAWLADDDGEDTEAVGALFIDDDNAELVDDDASPFADDAIVSGAGTPFSDRGLARAFTPQRIPASIGDDDGVSLSDDDGALLSL